jgi:hypothetical protein
MGRTELINQINQIDNIFKYSINGYDEYNRNNKSENIIIKCLNHLAC